MTDQAQLPVAGSDAYVPISVGRQLRFWVIAFLVLGFLLWLLSDVLLPFVLGGALAYLQTPLADRLERHGINRSVGALLIVGIVILAIIVVALLVVPILLQQLAGLVDNLPTYIARAQSYLSDPSRPWLTQIIGTPDTSKSIFDMVKEGAGGMSVFLHSVYAGGRALASFISVLIVMPVVAYYLIVDWHGMVDIVDSWVPIHLRPSVREIARDINTAIAGFLHGQTAVCLILGSYYALALSLVGLNYGLLIGVISGIITFVPYIGSMTGFVIGVSVAIAQFWPDWKWILVVVGIFLFGQFTEGNILAPKMVGENVGLHPVWVIFAMFAFGYLFGFVGLLIAVPLAAAIGVLFRVGLRRYLASPVYTGGRPV